MRIKMSSATLTNQRSLGASFANAKDVSLVMTKIIIIIKVTSFIQVFHNTLGEMCYTDNCLSLALKG